MSEYWKSTPKYWCKFCADFVKDTPFARREHEASPKHQRNIQRSLRELHKTTEREQREKARAQAEIARLNGVVPGAAAGGSEQPLPWKMKAVERSAGEKRQATAEERKRQLQQLADMGVAVPEEFRKEVAMVGGWETVASRPIYNTEEEKSFDTLSVGVRKRKIDEEEEEVRAAEEMAERRKGWGQAFKQFPGRKGEEEDLEVLMRIGKRKEVKKEDESTENVKVEEGAEGTPVKQDTDAGDGPVLKEEEAEKKLSEVPVAGDAIPSPETKVEKKVAAPAVVFKKRKRAAKPA
ncbi:uncharacterized protein BDZ99DRAFT_412322 [Mytilinidion resinicola]|uniref:Matrin-type domain-containing protein n=1 Tax=Mytilinidion resinicola TaxID=574789 RepID=A0A6A6YYK1_9PEZI|nr:uncharacterized protein BDZ99DRAFT_412322 [Mytilinidion resinicola]KAF2813513.1 hypothetical protein BDZ99DRAFT_412322 [Mytilinidion resinicola]